MREITRDGGYRVYVLQSTRGAYAYFVDGKQAILVDTSFPGRGPDIFKELGGMVKRLSDIVITHYDVDHIGSLKWIADRTGARVWLPVGDAPYILGQKPRPGLKRIMAGIMQVERPGTHEMLEPGGRVGPLEAVASPGHTPGHMAYRGLGCLFVGDAMATRLGAPAPTPRILATDPNAMQATMIALIAGFEGWILPAHGDPIQLS